METEQRIAVNIEDEMKRSYLDYAMSVIIGRALPDVRDGLKPVHRRVLWAMHELGNTYNKPYKKSARVVGDVIGKYHPHGDAAVYDTIVRLVQDFSMRIPLIDGQGNFGSVDGDAAAAMRYTEVRMKKVSEMMLADIEKETVDFQPNYDETLEEPIVLPARFPNLLVNGSSGIAVGMATNIPPHNLGEIIEATIHLVNHPEATLAEILKMVPGPDFPTGAFICGRQGIRQAYQTGRGGITMRAKAAIDRVGKNDEREAIVVTQIPYQVNKAKLIERIADLINEKKLEDISDLRDESDREGMRIVIELKRGAVAQMVLNNLYKLTPMQTTFGIINLSIVAGQPRVLGLIETLQLFISFRKEVVIRRTEYELRKARARLHILEGLSKALDHLDAIISLIRSSRSGTEAREGLMTNFGFSQIQAQAILDLQLQKLTGLERQKILDELKEVQRRITELEEILNNEATLKALIVKELREVQKEFADERRTQIVDEEADLTLEDLIPDEEMVITVTHGAYVKRTPLTTYRSQRRGGTGRRGMTTKTEDIVDHIFVATTHSYILIFSDRGQVYTLKVHEIPDVSAAGKGKSIVNLINLPVGEKVSGIVPVRGFFEGHYVVMVTRRGTIKKTELSEFAYSRSKGIIAINVEENDELIAAELSDGKKKIFLATHDGMAIYFDESDVRSMGRQAYGVRGIELRESDYVVGMAVLNGNEQMLTISEYGLGKRTPIEEYRHQSRGGIGVINMKMTERTGPVVSVMPVNDEDEVMLITLHGKIIRLRVGDIRETGRSAQGVKLIDAEDEDKVASASLIERQSEPINEEAGTKGE
ncbi:MAG: DNA gyrase subunit A [Blastocatellia bacterium]|nr:DNA gyrase subunit A [Blastocatellia bacterium]